jgi:hypothetical protein
MIFYRMGKSGARISRLISCWIYDALVITNLFFSAGNDDPMNPRGLPFVATVILQSRMTADVLLLQPFTPDCSMP